MADRPTPQLSLPKLLHAFRDAADELRWRISDTPNPSYEFMDGACRHDSKLGCSWRCPRRIKADAKPTHAQVREHVHRAVGDAAFALLDGYGEDAAHIDVTLLREALQAIEAARS